MVRGMKGTSKGCGSSADGVIEMKVAVKRCGSCIDGVMGRVMGMKGTVKG